MALYQQGTNGDYIDLLDDLKDFLITDHVDSAVLNAAGTGYSIGDLLTVSTGTASVACTAEVLTLSGSAVATFKIRQSGSYTVNPTLTNVATTVAPSGGTGCTLDLTMSGILWVANRDEDDNHQTGETEMQFEGVGDGSDEIYIGIRTYNSGGATNWELAGFTGFDGGLTWENQPGKSPGSFTTSGQFVPLTDGSTMTYWFNMTGRRIIVVIKIGTGYASMYLGWLNQFATNTEYPYPLLIMGCTSERTHQPDTSRLAYSGISDPVKDDDLDGGPGRVRSTDGQWYTVANSQFTTATARSSLQNVNVLPCGITGGPSGADAWFNNGTSVNRISDAVVPQSGDPGIADMRWLPTNDSGGDIYTPLPCTIIMSNPSDFLMGEMDDVFWVSTQGGMIAEDTLDDTNLTVFQCGNRTETWAHFCMRTSE